MIAELWSPRDGVAAAADRRRRPRLRESVGARRGSSHPTSGGDRRERRGVGSHAARRHGRGGAVSQDDVDTLRARRLRIPVDGVDLATLTSNFHQARGDGSHEAMDIMAPRGTPVLAVEGGRIAKLFTSKHGGLTIYQFDPSESFCYYYAHLDRYSHTLDEGKVVSAGEVIGYVGSTGNASPDAPHLHFAVFKLGPERRWWQGLPIDPYLVLR